MPYTSIFCFIPLHRYCIFCKLKVCGNAAKLFGTIFPTALFIYLFISIEMRQALCYDSCVCTRSYIYISTLWADLNTSENQRGNNKPKIKVLKCNKINLFTVCTRTEDFEYLKSKYIKLSRMGFRINLYFWMLMLNSVPLYYWNTISYIPHKRDWESHGSICLWSLWPALHDAARWKMAYVYSLIYFLFLKFIYLFLTSLLEYYCFTMVC